MVAHTYILRVLRLRQEDCQVKASLYDMFNDFLKPPIVLFPMSCFSDENWKTEYVPVPIPVPVYVPVPMHMYSQSIPVPTTVPVPVRRPCPQAKLCRPLGD